ncbi:unnamed protein product, partial [Aphanomyces euteiches]
TPRRTFKSMYGNNVAASTTAETSRAPLETFVSRSTSTTRSASQTRANLAFPRGPNAAVMDTTARPNAARKTSARRGTATTRSACLATT